MKRRSALLMLAFVFAVGGVSAPPVGAAAAHPNAVIAWNGIMVSSFAAAGLPPPVAIRLGAIVQASVFDAINGIDPQYTPIHVAAAGPPNASRQAAAAGAAYTALVALFSSQKPALDADLAASLAAMDDESSADVAAGLAWGDSVAAQILSWRAGDGFTSVLPPYVQGTAPGDWQPTPGPSTGPPKFRTLTVTTPFAMTSPSQFRPAGPPALTSSQYATALNEVEAYGSATSTVRSASQTETAKFWQMDTPVAMWDRVADSLAEAHHLNLIRSARLLALLNLAQADAIIAVFDAKNAFNFWRPVTAIQQAAFDGNLDTVPDPSWTSLLIVPYFQEYPSAHSGVSSAATTVLASVFGDDTQFTVTSDGLPGVDRSFNTFSDAVEQVADARVWAGFHFRFSVVDGTHLGTQIGQLADSTLMKRLGDQEA